MLRQALYVCHFCLKWVDGCQINWTADRSQLQFYVSIVLQIWFVFVVGTLVTKLDALAFNNLTLHSTRVYIFEWEINKCFACFYIYWLNCHVHDDSWSSFKFCKTLRLLLMTNIVEFPFKSVCNWVAGLEVLKRKCHKYFDMSSRSCGEKK